MVLVLDPMAIPPEVLEQLRRSLLEDLAETRELLRHPPGKVRDPTGIEAAAQLLETTIARLGTPGPPSPEAIAADANLAYATLIAVIDLVKTHTDMPRVPRRRRSE